MRRRRFSPVSRLIGGLIETFLVGPRQRGHGPGSSSAGAVDGLFLADLLAHFLAASVDAAAQPALPQRIRERMTPTGCDRNPAIPAAKEPEGSPARRHDFYSFEPFGKRLKYETTVCTLCRTVRAAGEK